MQWNIYCRQLYVLGYRAVEIGPASHCMSPSGSEHNVKSLLPEIWGIDVRTNLKVGTLITVGGSILVICILPSHDGTGKRGNVCRAFPRVSTTLEGGEGAWGHRNLCSGCHAPLRLLCLLGVIPRRWRALHDDCDTLWSWRNLLPIATLHPTRLVIYSWAFSMRSRRRSLCPEHLFETYGCGVWGPADWRALYLWGLYPQPYSTF